MDAKSRCGKQFLIQQLMAAPSHRCERLAVVAFPRAIVGHCNSAKRILSIHGADPLWSRVKRAPEKSSWGKSGNPRKFQENLWWNMIHWPDVWLNNHFFHIFWLVQHPKMIAACMMRHRWRALRFQVYLFLFGQNYDVYLISQTPWCIVYLPTLPGKFFRGRKR